jgi:uncharacterized protein YraI
LKRFLLLFMILWAGGMTLAQSGNAVLPDNIKVRSGPGESYFAIGALFARDTVTPLNRSEDGAWVLIGYGRGTGWIPRQEVCWQDNVDGLPVMPPNVTPTAAASTTPAPAVPEDSTLAGFVLLNDADRAFVRSGPGRGYSRLGQLMPGALVEPVARNEDGLWIMIRFRDAATLFDGFGWVARNLVQWRDNTALDGLSVVLETALTPTVTSTATETLIPSATPVGQIPILPTETATFTPVATDTIAPTSTDTPTLEQPTATNTPEPPTATNTDIPTATFTIEATVTLITDVAVLQSITPPVPSATNTTMAMIEVVTDTPLPAPIVTETPVVPTETPIIPTETPIISTETPVTPTEAAIAALPTSLPTPVEPVIPSPTGGEEGGQSVPVGLIVAGIVGLIALVYAGMFAQGMSAARRYDDGFVVGTCPVCHRGTLTVETRRSRTFGIPGVKRTVRCSECRSVLREKGTQRWIYAVDRIENPALYERLNGREVTDADLKKLV